jgi:putative ABC transport system permease protein
MKKLGYTNPEEIVGKILDVDHNVFPIVGVVKNFHNRSFHEGIFPQVLTCSARHNDVVGRSDEPPKTGHLRWPPLRKHGRPFSRNSCMKAVLWDDEVARFYEQEAVILKLVKAFAGIAVFIGCLGLYGLAAFMVARKDQGNWYPKNTWR